MQPSVPPGGAGTDTGAVSRAPRRSEFRHRVLIADDEKRIRQVLTRILRDHGIAADSAEDGVRAVAMASSGSYDLVILDLLMPGQDGFSALREIMRDHEIPDAVSDEQAVFVEPLAAAYQVIRQCPIERRMRVVR